MPGASFLWAFLASTEVKREFNVFFKKILKNFGISGVGGKFTIVSKRHKITEAVKASVSCTKKTFSRKRLSIAHFQSGEQFMGKALLPLSVWHHAMPDERQINVWSFQ
jgi:hypothetical protein